MRPVFTRAMRSRPSQNAIPNPTRYMSPYQRMAIGPSWIATGSKFGWTSTAGGCGDLFSKMSPSVTDQRSFRILESFDGRQLAKQDHHPGRGALAQPRDTSVDNIP